MVTLMEEKDERQCSSTDDHDSENKEGFEKLFQLITEEGSSSSCSIQQEEDEDKTSIQEILFGDGDDLFFSQEEKSVLNELVCLIARFLECGQTLNFLSNMPDNSISSDEDVFLSEKDDEFQMLAQSMEVMMGLSAKIIQDKLSGKLVIPRFAGYPSSEYKKKVILQLNSVSNQLHVKFRGYPTPKARRLAAIDQELNALLEILSLFSHHICSIMSAVCICLMDKIYAMIALEKIYRATKALKDSYGLRIVICQQKEEMLNKKVEDGKHTYPQRLILQEAVNHCRVYENLLRRAKTVTKNETRIIKAILYGNNTQQGLAELHEIHQQLMIVGNGLMDQLQIAKELSDEMMEMVNEMIAL